MNGAGGILVDSDNALGSPRGDVDDGFAIASLLLSGLRIAPIAGLASVAGNTDEASASRNNRVASPEETGHRLRSE